MRSRALLTVALLTAAGAVLRLVLASEGLYGDEMSTHWIVHDRGLGDVVATVHTDAEITPPLYFAAAWLFAQLGDAPQLLRVPSLLAGIATIPLIYAVGRRTVGTRAALVACALATCSPFLAYYSAEARAYQLMVALVLVAAFAVLVALERGGAHWWALYALVACAAVYTHYTSVFALAGLFGWTLWSHPRARRPLLIASAAAAVAFIPWLSGLRGDMESRTTDILEALQPFTFGYIRSSVAHWAIGFPYAYPNTEVEELPGVPALGMLALALVLAGAGITARLLRGQLRLTRPDPPLALAIVLALSVPLGELAASALGSELFGTRNLAASWPGFALCLAAGLLAAGPRLGPAAAALAVGAFAIGAVKLLDPDFTRPDAAAMAGFIERTGAPGDIVVDGASLSPAGVPTALQAELGSDRRAFLLGRDEVAYDPFRFVALARPVGEVVRDAAARARGRGLYVLVLEGSQLGREALAAVPPGFERTETRRYRGIKPTVVIRFEDQAATGA